jgi:hypothetical protein
MRGCGKRTFSARISIPVPDAFIGGIKKCAARDNQIAPGTFQKYPWLDILNIPTASVLSLIDLWAPFGLRCPLSLDFIALGQGPSWPKTANFSRI